MRRYGRLQLGVGFLVLVAGAALCAKAGATSTPGPSVCTRLVTRMRRAPATVLQDVKSGDAWTPWIIFADRVSSDSGAFRRIDSKWAAQFKGPFPPLLSDVETLPGTGLFVANAILGSGDCLNSMFLDWKWGGQLRLVPQPQLPLDMCSRDDNPASGALAMVLGQPAYIGSRSLSGLNNDSLMLISRWTGKTWAPPCPVSIRFTYRYGVTQLYCGAAKRVCNAARRIMPEVKRRYSAYNVSVFDALNNNNPAPPFHFRRALRPQEKSLVARAERIGLPKRITPASARPAWLRHLNSSTAVYFPLRLDGRLYVGAADSRPYQWPGTFFFVFRAPNASARQLVPLAAYTVHRMTSGIKSIQARNQSTAWSNGS